MLKRRRRTEDASEYVLPKIFNHLPGFKIAKYYYLKITHENTVFK